MEYNISKSRYCSAVQCPKILWLKKNMPEEFDSSVVNQAVLDAGSAVGDLAMGLFGDFVEVPFGNLSDMVAKTNGLADTGYCRSVLLYGWTVLQCRYPEGSK